MVAKQHTPAKRVGEPHVGIFWWVKGRLVIDRTPLSNAEEYDHFKIHPGHHISVWETFQQNGTAPREMEYEEAPRGRVMYDTETRQFTLLADKCILTRKNLVAQIEKCLNLPKGTKVDADNHYRCFTCLYGTGNEGD